MPRAGTVDVTYVNAASLVTDGFDLQLATRSRLPGPLREVNRISGGTATYINRYNITSASGTPRWRASWINSFIYKKMTFGVATYYTSGYRTTAEGITGPSSAGDCASALVGVTGAPTGCGAGGFWGVDLTFDYALTTAVHLCINVSNVADWRPPFDTATCGSHLYNPAWGAAGILGRVCRFGITGRF